jgi:hypothetical protein
VPDLDELPTAPLPGHQARHRGRDVLAAAATAVVVLVLGVTFTVVRGDRGPDAGTIGSGGPVGVEACGGGDLVASDQRREESGDTTYLIATLELARGVEPCSVEGYPTTVVLANGRPGGVETVPDDSLGQVQQLTVLPDRAVRVTLGWAVSDYCGPTVNDGIRLWVAPDRAVEIAGFGATSCSPGEGRPPVRVGPYTYVDPTVEQGTVAGLVTLNSGPSLGTGEFVTTGVVELEGEPDGYIAPIGEGGSFELELPAGRYQVRVSTHQWRGGTPYDAGTFEVVGGELSQLNVTLPLR